jgi:hypothetical protein
MPMSQYGTAELLGMAKRLLELAGRAGLVLPNAADRFGPTRLSRVLDQAHFLSRSRTARRMWPGIVSL